MKLSAPKNYNRFIAVIWGLLWLNFVTQYWMDASPLEAILAPTVFIAGAYPLTTYLSTTLMTRAIRTRKWAVFLVQFIVVSLAFGAVLYGLTLVFEHLETTGFFKDSTLFSWESTPIHEVVNISLSALVINFGFCGLRFFEVNLRLQQELHESQLKTLNGQINPHSMFNILNHIHILLQKDPQAADELLLQYADILRYQLYNANSDKVTLRQDTDYLKKYIEVEKVRWKNKLTVTDEWIIEQEELQIPPLLFITFIENAFKHVARSDSEKGYVNISLHQTAGHITFRVENSRSGLAAPLREDAGLGLPNIRKRLEILFPSRHTLSIDDGDLFYSTHLTITL